jgi:hypothetical protein
MYGMRSWPPVLVLLLVTGLVVPAPVGAGGTFGNGKYEKGHDGDDDDDHHHHDGDDDDDHGHDHGKCNGKGKGLCSPIPRGCRREDCRCDEDCQTCVRCRQFVCRSGKKSPPLVICRPCCRKKNGYVSCEPAPKSSHQQCVASPS